MPSKRPIPSQQQQQQHQQQQQQRRTTIIGAPILSQSKPVNFHVPYNYTYHDIISHHGRVLVPNLEQNARPTPMPSMRKDPARRHPQT